MGLGAVLYAMCTGRSPFRAESTVAVLRRVCDDVPRPIREVNPDIPEELVAIIDRLLAKDPQQRFQTAEEVSDLLLRYLAHLQDPAGTPPPEPTTVRPAAERKTRGATGGLSASACREHGQDARATRRWQRPLMLAVVVLLGLCVSVAVTEATGVTHLAVAIVRIATGAGTLVVEVDDPQVSITIDGEDLVITGAGPQEVRLKPGQYQVQAAKGGQVVKQELVTIDRGGRQVVKVALEPSVSPLAKEGPTTRPPPPLKEYEVRCLLGHAASVVAVCVSPDGKRILSGSDDRTLRLWDIKTGAEVRRFDGHTDAVGCVAFLPDGRRVVSGSRDATVRIWDAETGQEIQTLVGHRRNVSGVAALPDGKRVLSGSLDKTVRVWDIESGKEVRKLDLDEPIFCVAVSPDGRRVLCGDTAGDVQLWDLDKGSLLRRLHGHRGDVRGVAFSPDGRRGLSAGGKDETARFWDLESGRELHRFDERRWAHLAGAAFSPDGSWALVGGQALTFLLDAETGRTLHTLRGGSLIKGVAIAPDGCHAVTGSWSSGGKDNGVRLSTLPYRVWPQPALAQRLDELSKSIQSNPREAPLLEQRGRLYTRLGRYDEAARDFVTALAGADANAQRGMVYEAAVRDDQVFSRVASLLPIDEGLRIARGEFLAHRGQWEPAVRELKPLIEPYRANGRTLHYARLLLLTGSDEEYRRLCQRVSAQFGESVDARAAGGLAWFCTAGPESGVEPGRILRWAEQAGAASCDPVLVAANYRAGRYEQALECADQSRARFGSEFHGNLFLRAMAHHRLSQHEKSRQWYDAALAALRSTSPPAPDEPATIDLGSWLILNVTHREAKVVLGLSDQPAPQTKKSVP